jgi:hypothetical protein
MKRALLGLLALVVLPASAFAGPTGVIINAVEYGVAKFHRYDNKLHKYGANNVWKNFILPDTATTLRQVVTRNTDGSYTIFFSAAEEMLQSAIQIARQENRPIAILNLEAHGMPGGMWYPIDAAARSSAACREWVSAAQGADQGNYEQYYSATSKAEIMQFRQYSQAATHSPQPCTSSLNEWATIVRRNPEFVQRLAVDAEFHFVSCIVGLGLTGDNFTKGFAQVLFARGQGRVTTSINFGLGDWSMPEGMGFWDYLSDQQLQRDNVLYPRDRNDREIMQKGALRVAGVARGQLGSQVFSGLGFQFVNEPFNTAELNRDQIQDSNEPAAKTFSGKLSDHIRIPGTSQFVDLNR